MHEICRLFSINTNTTHKIAGSCRVFTFALLLMFYNPLAQAGNNGIDIIFDGDKLLTPADNEGKPPLILHGAVQATGLWRSPAARRGNRYPVINRFKGSISASRQAAQPKLKWETPVKENIARQPATTWRKLWGSNSHIDTTAGTRCHYQPAARSAAWNSDDIAAYLVKMRVIIKTYQATAMSDIFQGNSTVNTSNVEAGKLEQESAGMIDAIRSIAPPNQLADQHNHLATALSAIGNFFAPDKNNPLADVSKLSPAMNYLNNTLENYHQGVKNVIAEYGLSNSLDPLGDENQADNVKLSGAFNDLSQQLLNAQGKNQQASSMSLNDLQQSLNSLEQLMQGGNNLGLDN